MTCCEVVGLPDMKVALNLTSEPALPPRWTLGLPPPAPAPAVAKPAAKTAAQPGAEGSRGRPGRRRARTAPTCLTAGCAAARGRMGFPSMAGTGRLEPDRSAMSSQVNPIKCRIRNEDGGVDPRRRLSTTSARAAGSAEGLTAKAFAAQLAKVKGALEVHINSGGGDVFDGIAIGNAIRKHKGPVTTVVDGIAASIASVIAQAGQDRVMQPGSMMMIHDASTLCWGDAAEMAKTAADARQEQRQHRADLRRPRRRYPRAVARHDAAGDLVHRR